VAFHKLEWLTGVQLRKSYLYGADRLAAVSGSVRTWYLGDALGSVRMTLNDLGLPLTTVNYDPWGTPEAGAQPTTFGFTGELQDVAAGLVNLRARWYGTTQGRFLTHDTFAGDPASPQSLHLYAYTHDNPVNFTDPTGRYRCSEGSQDYQEFCSEQEEKLKVLDISRNPANSWVSTDSLRALLYMFSNRGIASDMPGGPGAQAQQLRQIDLSPAAERLDFVLWATSSEEGSPLHFGIQFRDTGFAPEFQDHQLWPDSSNQVGHFLTAVHLAYVGDYDFRLGIACTVGHELLSDHLASDWYQCLQGIEADSEGYHIGRFLDAMVADVQGDYRQRDCLLRQIVGLPDAFDPTNPTIDYLRHGNSMQDLRLSLKGWIFGWKVLGRSINSLDEAREWLIANLRPH
jgi:RHS repeat-associated protein